MRIYNTGADDADTEFFLLLARFLTVDKCAGVHSPAFSTEGMLVASLKHHH